MLFQFIVCMRVLSILNKFVDQFENSFGNKTAHLKMFNAVRCLMSNVKKQHIN